MNAQREAPTAYTIVADKGQLGPEARDWLLLGFALVGIGLSVGAWMMQQGEILIGCTVEQGLERCMAVLLPVFANHLGFPIAWLGIAGYSLIAVASAAVVTMRPKDAKDKAKLQRWRNLLGVRRWLVVGAFAFSLYFMWFQALFIHEFCPICVSSAATALALLVIELTRPNTLHLAHRHGPWVPRRRMFMITVVLIGLVSVGTIGLAFAWHPLAEHERSKQELFDRFEPAPEGPLFSSRQGKPTLVIGSKAGCPVCMQYFGKDLHDPRILELLNNYIVYVAEIPDDNGALIRMRISRVPALSITEDGEATRTISGLRPVEQVIDFLEGRPVPLD